MKLQESSTIGDKAREEMQWNMFTYNSEASSTLLFSREENDNLILHTL